MGKKLKITEHQAKLIKKFIKESSVQEICVERVKAELMNYEPMVDNVLEGGEYHPTPKFKILASEEEETITAGALLEYLKSKFTYNEEFLKQVIKDWCDGNLKDKNSLSKNISAM